MRRPTDDHGLLKHEAMDRIHVLSETLALHLLDHPFVSQRAALLEPLQSALNLLNQAYQAAGNTPTGDVEASA